VRPHVVTKFGGSSLADASAWRAVLDILRERRSQDPLVVVSAVGTREKGQPKTTDSLIAAATQGADLAPVLERHRRLLRDLDLPADLLDPLFAELGAELAALPGRPGSPEEKVDRVAGFGELFSAQIMAELLRRRGWRARAAGPAELGLRTDERFGDASIGEDAYNGIARAIIASREHLVVPGFVGLTADGRPTTLGRGGSDYTAAVLGSALKRPVEIWTDVDGVTVADPRLFPAVMRAEGHPRTIPRLSHEEAYQMAAFGSRVLHAKCLAAARVAARRGRHLELVIRNTFNPAHPGTAVVSHSQRTGQPRGMTLLEGVQLLTVYLDREEDYRDLLQDARRLEGTRLLMASYATGRASLVFDRRTPALDALERTYPDAHLSRDQVLIKVVGDGLGAHHAVLARIQHALDFVEDPVRYQAPLVHKSPQLLTDSTFELVVRKRGVGPVVLQLYKDLFVEREITLGLLGLGTVAQGMLAYARELYSQEKTGYQLHFPLAAVRDLSRPRPGFTGRLTRDPGEVVSDPRVDIVVELMGGLEPARTLILQALAHKKHVITANKAVLAEHGPEIFEAARRQGCNLAFEGSVCGEIPVIEVVAGIPSNQDVVSITGILNGTSNYLLTAMASGQSYAEALRQAQEKGFAEADPSLDVSGADAAQKLAILASLVFHTGVRWREIHRSGIDTLDGQDAAEATRMGMALRPVARAARHPEGLELWVGPALVGPEHPLYAVQRETNAVSLGLSGRAEPATLVGKGAGALPTARSVLRDILQVARKSRHHLVDLPAFHEAEPLPVVPAAHHSYPWWLRLVVEDRPGIFGRIASLLGEHGLSIRQAAQHDTSQGPARIMLMVKQASRGRLEASLEAIAQVPGVLDRLAVPVLEG
jgi:homoserine dehydrogenase